MSLMRYSIMEPHCFHHTYMRGLHFIDFSSLSVKCALVKVGLTLVGVFTT